MCLLFFQGSVGTDVAPPPVQLTRPGSCFPAARVSSFGPAPVGGTSRARSAPPVRAPGIVITTTLVRDNNDNNDINNSNNDSSNNSNMHNSNDSTGGQAIGETCEARSWSDAAPTLDRQ